MVKVIANVRGYHDGEIREAGTPFHISDEIWDDEKRRPKWVRPAKSAIAAVLEAKAETSAPAGEEDGGDEDEEQKVPEAIDAEEQKIPDLVEEPKQEVKPAQAGRAGKPKGNGVQEELGGPPPDWLPPEANGAPQPVND